MQPWPLVIIATITLLLKKSDQINATIFFDVDISRVTRKRNVKSVTAANCITKVKSIANLSLLPFPKLSLLR